MAPSVASISMSEFFKSHETLLTVRDPRRQISADLKRAKEVLARIQEIVLIMINNNNNNNNPALGALKHSLSAITIMQIKRILLILILICNDKYILQSVLIYNNYSKLELT